MRPGYCLKFKEKIVQVGRHLVLMENQMVETMPCLFSCVAGGARRSCVHQVGPVKDSGQKGRRWGCCHWCFTPQFWQGTGEGQRQREGSSKGYQEHTNWKIQQAQWKQRSKWRHVLWVHGWWMGCLGDQPGLGCSGPSVRSGPSVVGLGQLCALGLKIETSKISTRFVYGQAAKESQDKHKCQQKDKGSTGKWQGKQRREWMQEKKKM